MTRYSPFARPRPPPTTRLAPKLKQANNLTPLLEQISDCLARVGELEPGTDRLKLRLRNLTRQREAECFDRPTPHVGARIVEAFHEQIERAAIAPPRQRRERVQRESLVTGMRVDRVDQRGVAAAQDRTIRADLNRVPI